MASLLLSATAFLPSPAPPAFRLRPPAGRCTPAVLRMSTDDAGKDKPKPGAKVPDAITQTDNSAKRQQNAQLRAKLANADEPEAVRQMRLKREAEEAAAEAAAVEDAKKRAKEGNFVSGQANREAKLVEAYEAAGGKKGQAGGGEMEEAPPRDIRETFRKMQGSERRKRVDEEELLHQSLVDSPPVADCGDAIAAFLNSNLKEELGKIAVRYNKELAELFGKRNSFQNGAYAIPEASVITIDNKGMALSLRIIETGFFGNSKESTDTIRVDFPQPCNDADAVKGALIDMLRGCGLVRATAKVLKMDGVGSKGWSIPNNLFLNEIPCRSVIREWFYRDACDAVQVALLDDQLMNETRGRIRIECVPPEINPEMDTFRVGTMLELVRELALRIAVVMEKRVKICIQGPLGEGFFTGTPLMLSGMRPVLEGMDWKSRPGEMYEGLLVEDTVNRRTGEVFNLGNPEGRVSFGEVGADSCADEDEVFIVIAPQSMTGASVFEPLASMVQAAKGRPFLCINPRLKDKPSSGAVMQVGGRAQRIEFANSFRDIFHFRLLYKGSTFMFPITGALRYNMANSPFWTVFKREAWTDDEGKEQEHYEPKAVYEKEPTSVQITEALSSSKD
eukprot:CAMPEP_0173412868 /NCGR_PEP_ID=MMETSP1356-20130122/80508_1 /TAXON_ID=77927 ORGANISM="Hemiselmis virescens, Strain PCC157" /NCGR_SAMPLE_ID=MMETSP1356 /ASSEMBLY_ACC=CAM_ASM_000847 /LENGTH=618 /DNA_ID=CAMNT_0014374811 /DNA_START=145 /DNA_END=2001 /DNA_ORIENTATION=+